MSRVIKDLPAGQSLTVTVAAGDPPVHVAQREDAAESAVIRRGSRTFGPYLGDRQFVISGTATAATQYVSPSALSLYGLLTASDGAPVNAVQASLTINPTGDENALLFTAREYGAGGNSLRVEYVDPGANNAALEVNVVGNLISVSLATGAGGAITSTAAQVLAAVAASAAASALVVATISTGDGDPAANDGSGIVTASAPAPLVNGAGTAIGIARPGGLCVDVTNGNVYRNSGTMAAPAWTQLADVA